MSLRAAVIGAAGFLGAAIDQGMRRAGHTVVPILRGQPLPQDRFDVVVDCAGDSRRFFCNTHPRHAFDANVSPVLDRVTGIDHGLYVLASTIDVYGAGKASPAASREDALIRTRDLDGYSFTKALAEQVAERHATRALILRLGTLIGPGLRKNPVFDILNGQPLRNSDTSSLSLVDTRFDVQALLSLLNAGTAGIVNVTGNGPVRTADILSLAQRHRPDLPISFHAEREDFHYDVAVDKLAACVAVPNGLDMLDRYMAEQFGEGHGRA